MNLLSANFWRCFYLSFILLVSVRAVAQTNLNINQRVLPPSPDAQAFLKYSDYPVDQSTGIPKIEIPLYEVRAGALNLPISLSYHASGIKVNEIASSVGLGWSLNAGGMLSRVINGLADEKSFLLSDATHLTTAQIDNFPITTVSDPYLFRTVCEELRSKFFSTRDGRADDYFYSVGNKLSGQFTYDVSKQLHLLSYSNDKIIRKPDASNVKYEIVGNDGTRYLFDNNAQLVTSGSDIPSTSSWLLTQIISTSNTDTINLEYYHFNAYSYVNKSFSTKFVNDIPSIEPVYYSLLYSSNELIKKISYRGGSVVFNYAADRKDIVPDRLTNITINKTNEQNIEVQLQKFELLHNYFVSDDIVDKYSYRLQLSGVKVYDGTNRYINNYGFTYNMQKMPPMPHTTTPANEGCAQDYWGYYNGQIANPHLIPTIPPELFPWLVGSANRAPNETYMKSCSLVRIDYPTGGYTAFDFEANRVPGQTELIGGLRINKITSVANTDAIPIVKQYVYNIGTVLTDLYRGSYSYMQYTDQGIRNDNPIVDPLDLAHLYRLYYYSNPIIPLANHNGAPLMYTHVSEILDDNQGNKQKTDYQFVFEDDRLYNIDNPRFINRPYNKNTRYPDGYIANRGWTRGMPASTIFYKYDGTNYKQVKSITNEYVKKKEEVINTGIIINEKFQHVQGDPGYPCGYLHPGHLDFYYFDVLVDAGIKKLSRTTETLYSDDGTSQQKVTNFSYDGSNHLLPTGITSNINNNGTTVESRKYVLDVSQSGAAETARQKLISDNNISPVLKRTVQRNGAQISDETINYASFNTNQVFPATVTQLYQAGGQPVVLTYSDYDKYGNLNGIKKTGDLSAAYIYGYNGLYPVAEVKNADFSDIAYTSFEYVYPLSGSGKDLGNWQNTNGVTSVTQSDALSGTRVGVLNSVGVANGLTKTGLNSSKKYLVTAWVKNNGSVVITPSATNTTILTTRNGWTLYSWTLSVTTSVTVSASAAGTQLDELRLYPDNAMMSTATYFWHGGVSSECSNNNKFTYYEYDDFQRLSIIRDQNRNILKQFCYKYANTAPTLCNDETRYYSNKLDSPFNKVCGGGGTPVAIKYTIPANKYTSTISQADADQQAMREMIDSGQVYANRVGLCRYVSDAMEKSFTRNNCGTNEIGTSVIYRVGSATYSSTISKADANNMAQTDLNNNGQAYANATGICYPANTTFARISLENYDRSNSNNIKADVVVRFYSDYAGTIPKSVSNLTVNYTQTLSSGDYDPVITNYNATATGSSKVLMSQVSVQRYDPAIGDYWWTGFSLRTGNYWILN
ncbi:hypothetical protein DVR12_19070 [Chitinophaga silvatica]|uniref:DUF5977 domain-containing protein n=1 Tax=Chitinophaga silvatica TaxID=2282649 RepID=A0A3E1Y6T9_9BACT|nr:DUF5977 domain-containing protein [Chitinophaga silvatica]RFS20662.1 hypothetical protein DVR12_19070 [Chitinophaga silvatica]